MSIDKNSITISLDNTDESGMSISDDYITMSNETSLDLNIDDYYGHTIDVSTITTSAVDTGFDDLFTTDGITITLDDLVEFEDKMPSVAKIEDMCNDYPALAKAYENFKTIYAMVHQDWKGRQEDEPPF